MSRVTFINNNSLRAEIAQINVNKEHCFTILVFISQLLLLMLFLATVVVVVVFLLTWNIFVTNLLLLLVALRVLRSRLRNFDVACGTTFLIVSFLDNFLLLSCLTSWSYLSFISGGSSCLFNSWFIHNNWFICLVHTMKCDTLFRVKLWTINTESTLEFTGIWWEVKCDSYHLLGFLHLTGNTSFSHHFLLFWYLSTLI